jgi:hypothetical protein
MEKGILTISILQHSAVGTSYLVSEIPLVNKTHGKNTHASFTIHIFKKEFL